jgi:outer membrane lipoprotein-sorting protein
MARERRSAPLAGWPGVRSLLPLVVVLFLLLALAPAPTRAKEPPKPDNTRLQALFQKMNDLQKGIRTLRVKFVQTNNFQMLAKPQVLKGELTLKKPDTALYRYTSPSPLYFLIKDGDLLIYEPGQKRVVIQNIRGHQSKIIHYLGVGQPLEELKESFTVIWSGEEGHIVHLTLLPRKFRLKRKIAVLHFDVDDRTGLLEGFDVVEAEGDRIRFDFSDWEVNPALPPDAFNVTIPPGVKVQRQLMDLQNPFKP